MSHNVTYEILTSDEMRKATEDDMWAGDAFEVGDELFGRAKGFYLKCECGWVGNNPYPDQESADSIARQHEKMGVIEDKRAAALVAYEHATGDSERTLAAMLYNEPGALTVVKENG